MKAIIGRRSHSMLRCQITTHISSGQSQATATHSPTSRAILLYPPRRPVSHEHRGSQEKRFVMPREYTCSSIRCQRFYTEDLGEVVEHIRRAHDNGSLKRPQALGTPDAHGHVWYCFECESRSGNDHSSFNSDQAIWAHLSCRHEYCVSTIENLA